METNLGNATLLKAHGSRSALPHLQPDIIGLACIKLVVLGGPGVGKTALMQQFLGKAVMCRLTMPEAAGTGELTRLAKGSIIVPSPTVGVDFATRMLSKTDGDPLRLHLFDTSGQRRFRYLVDGYLRSLKDHDAVVIVYDVTNPESFKEADACISRVRRLACGHPQIALVGTKADRQDRAIAFKDGKAKADEYGIAIFVETSAAESLGKLENITSMIHSIERDIVEPLVQQCCNAVAHQLPKQSPPPQIKLDEAVKTQPSTSQGYCAQVFWSLQKCSKPFLQCMLLL